MDLRTSLSLPLAGLIQSTVDVLDGHVSPFIDPTFRPAYRFIEELNSHWPDEPDKIHGGIQPSWYTSPKQLMVEFVFTSLACIFLMHKTLPYVKILAKSDIRGVQNTWFSFIVKYSQGALLIFTGVVGLLYKIASNQLMYCLQPCFLSNAVLMVVVLLPDSRFRNICLNVYLCLMWSTIMALASPDTRGYTYFFQVEHFWMQHILLVSVPYTLLITGQIPIIKPCWSLIVFSFSVFCFYHFAVLLPFSVLFSGNLNYMISPPPNTFLDDHGPNYRPVQSLFCLLCTAFCRYVLVEPVCKLTSYMYGKEMHVTLEEEEKKEETVCEIQK